LSNSSASDTSIAVKETNAPLISSSDEIDDTLVWGNKNGFHFFDLSNETHAPTATVEYLNHPPKQ
jgi:hypothetical protein